MSEVKFSLQVEVTVVEAGVPLLLGLDIITAHGPIVELGQDTISGPSGA